MKALFFLLLSAILSISNAQNLNDSLLLYYPMNGNCLDSSGNGFDGIVNADLTTDYFGVPNRAYHFNGIDQYIDWPYSLALQPQLPISVAFFVKFDNAYYTQGVIFDTDFEQDMNSGVWMGITVDNKFYISYGDASGSIGSSSRRSKIGTTVVQDDTWYHVVGVINGPTDMKIYVDCVDDGGTYSGTGSGVAYSTIPGSLGRADGDIYNPAYQLYGSLDEFCYWNRALSSSDVEKLCPYVSIVEQEMPDFNLFPNPAKEYLYISEAPVESYEVELVSLTGCVISTTLISSPIFVKNLTSGYYLVRILDSDGVSIATKSFLKF